MKKRVVAVMLSLAMCVSTGAEASIVSAAEFSSETTGVEAAELDAETDVVEDVTEDPAVTEAPEVTVVPEDVTQDTEQTENPADGLEEDSADEQIDVDFTDGNDTDTAATTDVLQPEESSADTVGVGESVGDHEAKLQYTRWIPDNAKNPAKWKLKKPVTAKTQEEAAGTAEAAEAAGTSEEAEKTDAVDEGYLIDADESAETEVEPTEEPAQETEAQLTEDAAQDAGTTGKYYTSADGLVKITTLNTDGSELFTAYYAFDAYGYLITGRSLVGDNTIDYYYFLTADETDVINSLYNNDKSTEIKTPYNSCLGRMISEEWRWNAKDGVFNYYTPKQETIKAGVHKINGESYYLQKDGKPFVGDLTINGYVYYFRPAASENDIPGKMARNGWVSKDKQWRYFDADGRYIKKGVGAYKVLSNSNNLYLLNANGYLITNKRATKGADGYYYLADGNGVAYRNKLVKYGKYRYYFMSNGRRAPWKKRWVKLAGTGNRYYYFGKVGGRIEEQKGIKKVTVNGKFIGWFCFPASGNNLQNTWNGGRYYLADGRMASGVTKINGKYYFFQRSSASAYKGVAYKNKWIKYNNKYYYASGNSTLIENGWKRLKSDGKYYYFLFQNCTAVTNKSGVKRGGVYGSLDSRGRFIEAGWVVASNKRNLVRFMDSKTGKYVKNTVRWINGVQYRFDKKGYRVNDRTNEFKRSRYYLECDRVNGVMTVYTDSSREIPIKTIRVSVGNPTSLTTAGTYRLSRSARWQQLMGPSWGQYGTHVDGCGQGGIFVHSIACSQMNDHNLPAGEYYKLGNPASHGCIRCCVADAKWVFDNCNGSTIRIFDGKYAKDEVFKGPLGRKAITPLRGNGTFDPTDPAYAGK